MYWKEIITEAQLKKLSQKTNLMSEEQMREYIFWKWFYNKAFFWKYFLSDKWKNKKGSILHKEIHDSLDKNDTLAIICPRWHWKTTTILINIMHSICYKIYWSQLYIAQSWLWEESLWKIRQEFETNSLIREFFWVPDVNGVKKLIPTLDKATKNEFWAKKWRAKHLEFLNWEALETMSKGQSIRWRRPKRILVDDLDENKDVMNKTIVEKTRAWFFTSLFNTLLPGWKIAILWTIVWNMCMVKYCKEIKKWHTIERKAIENWKALWKEQWSLEQLEERKSKLGTAFFNQEFMNIPISVENRIVKEQWIRYREILPDNFENIIMAIDPAISEKENADFTWITILWVKWDNKYVLYSKPHKMTPNSLKRIIKALNIKYKPNKILVENVAYQEMLRQELSLDWLPVIWIRPHRDKITRLQEVAWQIEFWNVYFAMKEQEELIYQLTNMPDVEHEDVLDSCVYCLKESITATQNNVEIF